MTIATKNNSALYLEKLKDPRWQKKRLEIFERDGWACASCDDKNNTLVCHHRYYLPGKEPWDYPEDALVTLCEDCHEGETEYREDVERDLIMTLRKTWWFTEIEWLTGVIEDGDITPDSVFALINELINEKMTGKAEPHGTKPLNNPGSLKEKEENI